MRNISFALTTPQFLDGTKDVTRRVGWLDLAPGNELCAVRKGQGLKKGEKVERLGMIRVISVRQEQLAQMTRDPEYGRSECKREGFPAMTPGEFIDFFCRGHRGAWPDKWVTRIEFERLDGGIPVGGAPGPTRCPNGLEHGNCGFPDCVSSCPGRLSLSPADGNSA